MATLPNQPSPALRRLVAARCIIAALCVIVPARASAEADPVASKEPASFALTAGSSFCDAVWSDSVDRIAFACGTAVRLASRGEADSTIAGVLAARVLQIAGTGRGAGIALAVAGEEGHAARYRRGVWQSGQAPCRSKTDLVAAALDPRGRTWYAGLKDGLYLWGEERWERFPYPDPKLRVTTMVAGTGGVLFLAGNQGELLRFDGRGAFTRLKAAGLPGPKQRGKIKGLWFGRHSGLLYAVSGHSQLYSVDLRRGVGRARKLASSWVTAMTGTSAPGGDLLLITGPSKLIGYHRGTLFDLPAGSLTFPAGMALNRADRRLYAACRGKGIAVRDAASLFEPAARKRAAQQTEQKHKVSGIGLPRSFLLSFYLNMGPSVALAAPELGLPETETSFALDLELGARLPFAMIHSKLLMLWPTLGYSYDASDALGGHLFAAGLGISFQLHRHVLGMVALSRFLVGSAGGQDALGTRNGLRFEILLGIVSLEAAHQMLYLEAGRTHELRVMVGTDLMMWFRVATMLNLLFNPGASSGKLFWRSLFPVNP